MSIKEKTKFVHEVETNEGALKARRPFRMEADNRRRFVRVEISAPMTMNKLRDHKGEFWPDGEWHVINGTILNISAGGVLVDIDQQIQEGDVVALHFILQDTEALNDVLGLVKRVEQDEEGLLAGIEFISRGQLKDFLSVAELDMLPETVGDFQQTVRRVLAKYIYEETGA